jgi:hypothetical protein
MVNEDAALLNRRVTHMTPAALFSRRLQSIFNLLWTSFVGASRKNLTASNCSACVA